MIHSFLFQIRPSRANIMKHLYGERKKFPQIHPPPNFETLSKWPQMWLEYQKSFLNIPAFLLSLLRLSFLPSDTVLCSKKVLGTLMSRTVSSLLSKLIIILGLEVDAQTWSDIFKGRGLDRYQLKSKQIAKWRVSTIINLLYFCLNAHIQYHFIEHPRSTSPCKWLRTSALSFP